MTGIDYEKLREVATNLIKFNDPDIDIGMRCEASLSFIDAVTPEKILAILDEIERLRTRNARLQTVADSVEAFINCEDQACGMLYDHMEQCFHEYNEKEQSEQEIGDLP